MEGKLQLAETKGQHCPRSASNWKKQPSKLEKRNIRLGIVHLVSQVTLCGGETRGQCCCYFLCDSVMAVIALLQSPKKALGGESLSWGISREERGVSRLLLLLLWLWRRSNLHVDRIARRSEAVYCTQAGSVTTNRVRGEKKTGQMRCEKCLLSLKFSSLIR